MSRTAGFFGSFDPVTRGHIEVVSLALSKGVADHVTVIVKPSRSKNLCHFLTRENAARLFEIALPHEIKSHVTVRATDSPMTMPPPDGVDFYIRGIRDEADIPFEERVVKNIFRDAQQLACQPTAVRWIRSPTPAGLYISSTGARDILYSDCPSSEALESYMPEAVSHILLSARLEARPYPQLPETLQIFNAVVATKIRLNF